MTRELRVRDAMAAPVVTALPAATLEELAQLMLSKRVGCVVIVDADERPVGIVTETDFEVTGDPIPFTFFRWPRLFGKYVWSERSMEDMYELARSRTAESIMSTPLHTVGEDEELGLRCGRWSRTTSSACRSSATLAWSGSCRATTC